MVGGATGGRTWRGGLTPFIALAVGSAISSGCSTIGTVYPRHIVMFEKNGRAIDPTADPRPLQEYPELDDAAWKRWLDLMLDEIKRFDASKGLAGHDCQRVEAVRPGAAEERQQKTPGLKGELDDRANPAAAAEQVVKVLIFVHGGLNTQSGTIERATELHDEILRAGYYPIFVNWDSSLLSSYWSHLVWVRQGAERPWGPVFAPFYLLGDLARGLVRLPSIWWWRAQETLGWGIESDAGDAIFAAKDKHELQMLRAEGDGDVDLAFLRGVWQVVTMPVRAATTYVVDVGGQGSWNAMQRRVELLFEQDEFREIRADDPEAAATPPPTQLMQLMQRLQELQTRWELDDSGGVRRRLEVTLVGHSMGGMVINRLLQRGTTSANRDGSAGEGEREKAMEQAAKPRTHPGFVVPEFKTIVYMASACSVHQYEASALPYLEQHEDTILHHVVLDPEAETRETNLWDISPRGSLLVWIDDFLSSPYTVGDRTAGRYVNLLPALPHTPMDLRKRIFVKFFDDGDERYPQQHGDFDDGEFEFWTKEFWWE